MPTRRLAIIQEYVPVYRLAFFDLLVSELAEYGIACDIIASLRPPGSYSKRGDAAKGADWLVPVPPAHSFEPWSSGPIFSGYGTDRYWRGYDGLVMGLRGTSLDLHLELLRKRRTGRKIGVWGHLSRFIKPPNSVDLALERWQMRRSDHVFAYTAQGADSAISAGVPREKVTAVMNSIDVSDLLSAYQELTQNVVNDFMARHSLMPGKIFGLLGGLDGSKRVSFIAEVLERLWLSDRRFKLIVGGQGEEEGLLSPAISRGQVIMLGYCGPHEKALILRVSQALLNPGRIGLVAVDSLAVGIPILTTDWDFHAPEFDYLHPGRDVFSCANTVADFSELIASISNPIGQLELHTGRPFPSIQVMAMNFATGVREMLA